ncbi:hypothetical protein DITRI_Ditri07aG0083800 [Diplodiscus trichospermus]
MEGTSRSMEENEISKKRKQIIDWGKLFDPDSNQVVAQFLGRIPNFSYFQKMVNVLWGADGEVKATVTIPSSIEVKMSNGPIVAVKVTTPWLPQRCSHYNISGHSDKNCMKKQNPTAKVWVPKKFDRVKSDESKNSIGPDINVSAKEDKDVEVKKSGEKQIAFNSILDKNTSSAACHHVPKKAGSVNRFSVLDLTTFDGSGEIVIKEKRADDMDLEEQYLQDNLEQLLQFTGWSLFHNYEHATNGRIWLLWRSSLKVDLVATSDQKHENWILAGDFNIIADTSECLHSDASHVNISDIEEFVETLYDHAFTRPLFTWSNHQQSQAFLARKLDRVLINDNWPLNFASSKVEFLAPKISDHCPSLIQLFQNDTSPPKPFRFFNFWTKHSEFLAVVRRSWNLPISGRRMTVLYGKLKRLKRDLKEFNRCYFGGISL